MGLFILLGVSGSLVFEAKYKGRVYPGVSVGGVPFGGKTPDEIVRYWQSKNEPFQKAVFTLTFEGQIATVSGETLGLGYDATLSATQAYLIGRSGYVLSDLYRKFLIPTNLSAYFRWNTDTFDSILRQLGDQINLPVRDALFQFSGGRVTLFRPSSSGRAVNLAETTKRFAELLATVPQSSTSNLALPLVVDIINPSITTAQVNSFGIKELIGKGVSLFAGSAEGRIHNIVLAASRLNGILIKPGETFSFNDAVGDISAATGYQPAYIIKDGRTVLGDGGGVCQVSTTLFRAALNAGLPIVERYAHSYRVKYYEQGGFKPGLDATVYAPTYDLKFKNDTSAYVLIQTKVDLSVPSLTFELYGTNDGRSAEVIDYKIWDVTPPPPDLYQDDPTLPPGVTKQVDFAAWGAKTSFEYIVRKNGQITIDKTFYSNFRPWQAVYLRGPQ